MVDPDAETTVPTAAPKKPRPCPPVGRPDGGVAGRVAPEADPPGRPPPPRPPNPAKPPGPPRSHCPFVADEMDTVEAVSEVGAAGDPDAAPPPAVEPLPVPPGRPAAPSRAMTQTPGFTSASEAATVSVNLVADVQVTAVWLEVSCTCIVWPSTAATSPDTPGIRPAPPPTPPDPAPNPPVRVAALGGWLPAAGLAGPQPASTSAPASRTPD